MISLSPRQWLAQWPRRLQFFAVALCLLGAIAPAWHVCELGGHLMTAGSHNHAGENGGEHGGHFEVVANRDGSPGPIICACAAPKPDAEIAGPAFSARPDAHHHVNCLALLLQTMPLRAAAASVLSRVVTTRALVFARPRLCPAFGAPRPACGRAPPANC